jgi:K+-transporting ATPase A subunit
VAGWLQAAVVMAVVIALHVPNVIEIVLMLLVPVACIRMFGRMVGQLRQGWALLAVAGLLLAGWIALTTLAESHPADPAGYLATLSSTT